MRASRRAWGRMHLERTWVLPFLRLTCPRNCSPCRAALHGVQDLESEVEGRGSNCRLGRGSNCRLGRGSNCRLGRGSNRRPCGAARLDSGWQPICR
eukprot:261758-Chlamydomonas_euryale.AAC.1